MAFQFVNSTTDTLNQNDDTRRKIRSHAMKDYRARQRGSRQGHGKTKNDTLTGTPSKPSRLTFRFVVDTPEDANEDAATERSTASTPLSLSPSIWGKETPDIFQSPAQLQQMFGICREWFQWLRPDIKADFAGKPIDQAWDISPSPMLLAANCLAAVGGLDAADRNRPSGLEVVFKGRVLHEIQIRMQSSLAATTDETMSTLLFLVSYEFYRLNPEAITHLKGLRSILRLKGQNRAGMRWGGGMVLETLDLLTALWQSSDPLMTPVEEYDGSSNAPPRTSLESKSHRAFLARQAYHDIADVLTTERLQANQISRQCPADEDSRLDELLEACMMSLDGFWEGKNPDAADNFFDSLSSFSSEYCDCEPGTEKQSHHVARAFHQTMAILYNVITNRHVFQHATNQPYVQGLVKAVTSVEERTWKPVPYLRYFALLTGAAAAKEPCDKSFFHTHLGKCQMVLGIAKWPAAKRFIVNFLRLRKGIEPKVNKTDRRRTKNVERLIAAGGQETAPEETQHQVTPMDDVLGYGTLSWHGGRPDSGLEMLLTNDRTFHEAMLSGAFWKTE